MTVDMILRTSRCPVSQNTVRYHRTPFSPVHAHHLNHTHSISLTKHLLILIHEVQPDKWNQRRRRPWDALIKETQNMKLTTIDVADLTWSNEDMRSAPSQLPPKNPLKVERNGENSTRSMSLTGTAFQHTSVFFRSQLQSITSWWRGGRKKSTS